jgi:hypothetical protein
MLNPENPAHCLKPGEIINSGHDVPVDLIVSEWKKAYGEERVNSWISIIEGDNGKPDFTKEEIVS